MTEAQLSQLLVQWNDTQTEYPAELCLHQLFENQVARQPEAIAVIANDQQLTYQELDHRANRMASFLRKRGVGPEVLVGICLERSVDLVIAILGILKAGGAYVPLDPTYPAERLQFMIEDTRLKLLVTEGALREGLPETATSLVAVDFEKDAIAREPVGRVDSSVTTQNLAYVIYTSGSTGRPKGIALRHQGVVNNITDINRRFSVGSDDRILVISSPSFDMNVYEVLGILAAGGGLVVPQPTRVRSPHHLVILMFEHRITIWNSAPALLALLLDQLTARADIASLPVRLALLGGDWVPLDLPTRMRRFAPDIVFIVLGGATEASIHSTIYRVERVDPSWKSIPYGKPMANQLTYVLDENGYAVPPGEAGELHIGGSGLARGYLNRPDLTAEKFIPNPFGEGRLYRTGDLVRWMSDGTLELVGRIDHQVKIRGFRVEIGEIESVMRQHPSIKEAVVVARLDASQTKFLAAYLVPSNQQVAPTTRELRAHLREFLPEYMVPSAFVLLESLPLSPNGKIDRRGLPEPVRDTGHYLAPRTRTEELLATTWAEVLRLERVGVDQNFLELGGHSLLAAQIVARLRNSLGVDLGLQAVLESPSLESLAAKIDSGQGTMTSAELVVPRVERTNGIQASFGQHQMWVIEQLEPGHSTYNVSFAMRLLSEQELKVDGVKWSLSEIVRRHEVLRTTLQEIQGQLIQVIADASEVSLPIVDLRATPETERRVRVSAHCAVEAARPFNLAKGPLFRASLMRLEETDNLLIVSMHHAISDGWSMAVLLREFSELYASFVAHSPSSLPDLPIQYVDYSGWQRQFLSKRLEGHAEYWKRHLTGAQRLELPTDLPDSGKRNRKGKQSPILVPTGIRKRIQSIARQEQATPFMVLLAVFKALLHRYSGQTDIVLATVVANRFPAVTESLVGYFANTVVLRTDLSGGPSFRELLSRVRKEVVQAFTHQELPFVKVVEALRSERTGAGARAPIFRVMFVLLNSFPVFSSPVLAIHTKELHSGSAMFDLSLHFMETEHGYEGTLEYDVALFTQQTIDRFIAHLQGSYENLWDVLQEGRPLARL